MRRLFVIICVIGLGYFVWHQIMERSATIALQSSDYKLTFTMAWGFGMKERLTLNKAGAPWQSVSSEWIEIWKKPYNSGAVVYASTDGQTYYIGTSYKLGVLVPEKGTFIMTCDNKLIPERTPLGKRLSLYGNAKSDENIAPDASRFPDYIEKNQFSETSPASSPPSKYYVGLLYIGRFGVVRGSGRGSEVSFVTPNNAAEPRVSLYHHCG